MTTTAPTDRERTIPFVAGDGLPCNLIHAQGERTPTRGPVLLVHGAGVRANIFRAPVERTLVDELLDDGWDVWLENWRASVDLAPNRWTLDQAALFDHPVAVQTVLRETGASTLSAIIHCQGSTSFMMSAVAGLVPEVTHIISNAVSLHPVVPFAAGIKLRVAVPTLRPLTDYIDCQWGVESPTLLSKALTAFVKLTHRECDNIVCRYASFTYGVGFPTLWRHENLNDETHEWLTHEFGAVPLTFFNQIGRSVRAGHLISVEGRPELPGNFVAQPPRTEARLSFFAGEQNRCFLAESQRRTYEYFHRLRPGFHSLHILPDYGHLDVFMGKNAARDVFPLMLTELNRTPSQQATSPSALPD
ncbi:MAG: esterase [Gemmatimonadota bacterium]